MSDETLKITHLRLCECGLPAGHETLCRPSRHPAARRVDTERANAETDRRAERWTKRKQQQDADRRTRRSQLDPWQKHQLVAQRLAPISSVGAGQLAPSRGGGERVGPPRQQELDADPRWRSCWEVIDRQLDRVHLLLDEAEGHGPVGERQLSAEEKDAMIVDPANDGLSVAQLIQDLGADICGSATTVARVRSRYRNALCTRSGMAPDPGCRCPTCRRVA